jgi:hypothetical protein
MCVVGDINTIDRLFSKLLWNQWVRNNIKRETDKEQIDCLKK